MVSVLIIEANDALGKAASDHLASKGHDVVLVNTAIDALRALRNLRPEAIVFSENGEDLPFEEFYGWLHSDPAYESTTFFWLASATTTAFAEATKVNYERCVLLRKPFPWPELSRLIREATTKLTFGSSNQRTAIKLSRDAYELRGEAGSVLLTPTEFRLADYLMEQVDRIIGTEELLQRVWGYYPRTGNPEVVRSHVRNLRLKIKRATSSDEMIQTVPGHGYRLTLTSRTST